MNRVRSLFQRDGAPAPAPLGNEVDLEAATKASPPVSAPPAKANGLDPAAQLRAFRQLVGITQEPDIDPSSPAKGGKNSRAAPNVGIYASTVANETSARRAYTAYSIIINGCLGIQVLVAAGLTAMGAANVNHSIITAFGAINTAIAGFHTYLQGYGLPGRLKYYENAWHKVRQTIEQRERDFTGAAFLGAPLPNGSTLAQAVADIEKLYNDTLAEIQANAPGSFKSSNKPGQSPQQPDATAPPPGSEPPMQYRHDEKPSSDSSTEQPEKANTISQQQVGPSAPLDSVEHGLEQGVPSAVHH